MFQRFKFQNFKSSSKYRMNKFSKLLWNSMLKIQNFFNFIVLNVRKFQSFEFLSFWRWWFLTTKLSKFKNSMFHNFNISKIWIFFIPKVLYSTVVPKFQIFVEVQHNQTLKLRMFHNFNLSKIQIFSILKS
jgi:hypothetical protein